MGVAEAVHPNRPGTDRLLSDLRLQLFSTGTLALAGAEVPVPFFLIHHPQGTVVVDGGNPLAVARDPRAHWGRLADVFTVHMTQDDHCLAQLIRAGIDPAAVTHVVQTHLHIDHTGALGHFPHATVVLHEHELEAARQSADPLRTGYVNADYADPAIPWQTIGADHDLFGDGAIRLLQTPGHSAGHLSLLLELPSTGPVLLTADACDNGAQWEGRMEPRPLHSAEQAAVSLTRLHELAAKLDPLLVFGHDPRNWASLEHEYR